MEFVPIALKDLADKYQNGSSLRSLAKEFGTSKLTIKRKLQKAGIPVLSSKEFIQNNKEKHRRQSSNRYNYDQKIFDDYHKENKSINQIINFYDVSESKVRRIIGTTRIIDGNYIASRFADIYNEVKPDWIDSDNLYNLYYNEKWSISDIAKHYGYDEESIRQAFIKYGIKRRSTSEATFLCNKNKNYESGLEAVVKRILDDNSVKYDKVIFGGYEFDFLIDNKLLLEINGLFYHLNCDKKVKRDEEKYEYWHNNLREKYDFKILWEHFAESVGSLYDLLNKWIGFNNEYIDKINIRFDNISYSEADNFCKSYHYHRKTRKGCYYGAFYDGEMIGVAVFSSITRKQSADRLGVLTTQIKELTRFCINPRFKSDNLASFLLAKFEKLFKKYSNNTTILLTFADQTTGHIGTVYKACNWIPDGETKESYYYEKGGMRWHKRTIWQHAKSLKMKEMEFASLFGISRVNTLKKYRFIKMVK